MKLYKTFNSVLWARDFNKDLIFDENKEIELIHLLELAWDFGRTVRKNEQGNVY